MLYAVAGLTISHFIWSLVSGCRLRCKLAQHLAASHPELYHRLVRSDLTAWRSCRYSQFILSLPDDLGDPEVSALKKALRFWRYSMVLNGFAYLLMFGLAGLLYRHR